MAACDFCGVLLATRHRPPQHSSRAAVRALDRKVPASRQCRHDRGARRQRDSRRSIRRELDRFARLASEWWDANGQVPHAAPDRPGTADVPARRVAAAISAAARARACGRWTALSMLDVGCGGGLVCEPLARLGAAVTGLDPAAENIEAARRHAAGQGLDIDYRVGARRGPGGGGPHIRCRRLPGGGGARARRRRVPQDLRSAGAARRADAALDHQPHDQGLPAGHRRRASTCCAGCRSARTSGSGS